MFYHAMSYSHAAPVQPLGPRGATCSPAAKSPSNKNTTKLTAVASRLKLFAAEQCFFTRPSGQSDAPWPTVCEVARPVRIPFRLTWLTRPTWCTLARQTVSMQRQYRLPNCGRVYSTLSIHLPSKLDERRCARLCTCAVFIDNTVDFPNCIDNSLGCISSASPSKGGRATRFPNNVDLFWVMTPWRYMLHAFDSYLHTP